MAHQWKGDEKVIPCHPPPTPPPPVGRYGMFYFENARAKAISCKQTQGQWIVGREQGLCVSVCVCVGGGQMFCCLFLLLLHLLLLLLLLLLPLHPPLPSLHLSPAPDVLVWSICLRCLGKGKCHLISHCANGFNAR